MLTSASLLRMQIPLETIDHSVSLYTSCPPPLVKVVDSDEEKVEGEHVDPHFRKTVLERLDRVEASQDLLLQGQENLFTKFQNMQLTQSEILHLL